MRLNIGMMQQQQGPQKRVLNRDQRQEFRQIRADQGRDAARDYRQGIKEGIIHKPNNPNAPKIDMSQLGQMMPKINWSQIGQMMPPGGQNPMQGQAPNSQAMPNYMVRQPGAGYGFESYEAFKNSMQGQPQTNFMQKPMQTGVQGLQAQGVLGGPGSALMNALMRR
jgi:hypothetical protein